MLDYVFGYRGFDTRQNVHIGGDGSVVYHAAGAGVVFDPLTKTQSFYLEHNDDIICLALCRNPKLAHVVATGRLQHQTGQKGCCATSTDLPSLTLWE